MKTLADLARGQRARLNELTGEPHIVQRLLELGLTEGEEIEVLQFAPLGDPIEILIRGYRLSLRRAEARFVIVEPV